MSRGGSATLALSAFVFAAYLVLVQLTVLHVVCEWCTANDSLIAAIALLAVLRARADLDMRTADPSE